MIRKVGILGCSGRMGLEICGILAEGFHSQGTDLELADAVCRRKSLTNIDGVSTRLISEPPREPVHVWIDFSQPAGTVELLKQIDTPVVIGTTGFDDHQMQVIKGYATKHPVLLTANTSPGMNLLLSLMQKFKMPGWVTDVVLVEEHHRGKKDAPSGSAKTLVETLKLSGCHNVQVHSVRGGAIVGVHTVRLIGPSEEIVFTHRVSDRKVFAQGALESAVALMNAKLKTPGLYGMKDLLEELKWT